MCAPLGARWAVEELCGNMGVSSSMLSLRLCLGLIWSRQLYTFSESKGSLLHGLFFNLFSEGTFFLSYIGSCQLWKALSFSITRIRGIWWMHLTRTLDWLTSCLISLCSLLLFNLFICSFLWEKVHTFYFNSTHRFSFKYPMSKKCQQSFLHRIYWYQNSFIGLLEAEKCGRHLWKVC